MGLCAQTPGHIVVQEKGFSCTRIVYHNGRYFAYRKKYKFFSIVESIIKCRRNHYGFSCIIFYPKAGGRRLKH